MKNLTNGAKVNGLGGIMKAMASINLNEMSGNSVLEALIKKSTTKVGKEVKFIEGLRKEIIMESFKTQFLTSNLSIGVISNGNSTIVSLFDHPEKAAKALKLALGLKTIGTKKYKGLQAIVAERAGVESDDVNVYCHFITEEVSIALIEEMKNANLRNKENVFNILFDLNIMYRMYQELTIDAAKKVYEVAVRVMLELYRPYSLQEMVLDYDYEAGTFSFAHKAVTGKVTNTSIRKIGFHDNLSQAQLELAKHLAETAATINEMDVTMSDEDFNKLNSYRGFGPVKDLNNTVKYAYGNFTAKYMAALQKAKLFEDEGMETAARDAYRQEIQMLTILCRQLLDGYTAEQKATIMQTVACKDNKSGELNRNKASQLATSILTEEFLTSVLNNHAQVTQCGYKVLINGNLDEGDVVEFAFGMSEDGSLLDCQGEEHLACGEFEIIERNGKLMAVKDIEITVPEADYTKRVFAIKYNEKLADLAEELMVEGKKVIVDECGDIKVDGVKVGTVKMEESKKKKKGNRIEDLLGVTGTIEFVSINSDDNSYNSMFLLTDVAEYVDESNDAKYDIDDIEDDLDGIEDVDGEDNDAKYNDDDIEFDENGELSVDEDEFEDEDEIEEDFEDEEIEDDFEDEEVDSDMEFDGGDEFEFEDEEDEFMGDVE